ncbi:MAG: hypothetical protein COT84_08785 [Chlamydiae bacterium CG10_big_fil_rev_8_21_14_0_10_35_9]|nr:MAG: hypothetical protein COT84_08785 [Chlamydiae bacterium CG10_big_fil_rev_8_21_14_0_10_35_9]
MKKKIGRNDPCPCGSGKKFKKCCESSMIGKKYKAHKIESQDRTSSKIAGLTSLFQAPIVPNKEPAKEETTETTEEEENNSDKKSENNGEVS